MAKHNRTLTLSNAEADAYSARCPPLSAPTDVEAVANRVLCQELEEALPLLPDACADLLVIDPPYNLTKAFGRKTFRAMDEADYEAWLESWLLDVVRLLKPNGSAYICADWRCSGAVQRTAARHLTIRNRITWEREKGRGAKTNWKNASEDIWFCTRGNDYYFDVDAVKLRRQVIAPYRANGKPKDWRTSAAGKVRDTHPSNLWTDLTVPFWSMPENTEHPTQKPEKLMAKLILASCPPDGLVVDPFAGVGTSAVVARKLGRRFLAIEREPTYCALAMKRLELAADDTSIQGFSDGIFWERNSGQAQQKSRRKRGASS